MTSRSLSGRRTSTWCVHALDLNAHRSQHRPRHVHALDLNAHRSQHRPRHLHTRPHTASRTLMCALVPRAEENLRSTSTPASPMCRPPRGTGNACVDETADAIIIPIRRQVSASNIRRPRSTHPAASTTTPHTNSALQTCIAHPVGIWPGTILSRSTTT